MVLDFQGVYLFFNDPHDSHGVVFSFSQTTQCWWPPSRAHDSWQGRWSFEYPPDMTYKVFGRYVRQWISSKPPTSHGLRISTGWIDIHIPGIKVYNITPTPILVPFLPTITWWGTAGNHTASAQVVGDSQMGLEGQPGETGATKCHHHLLWCLMDNMSDFKQLKCWISWVCMASGVFCPSAICFGEGRDEQMLNVSHEIFRTFMMKLSLFF